MRGDFQQFYNLNLDDLGDTYSIHHAASLVAVLPFESRTVTIIKNRNGHAGKTGYSPVDVKRYEQIFPDRI